MLNNISINESTANYQKAAYIATHEGFTTGSHDWWKAIRYHLDFTNLLGDNYLKACEE